MMDGVSDYRWRTGFEIDNLLPLSAYLSIKPKGKADTHADQLPAAVGWVERREGEWQLPELSDTDIWLQGADGWRRWAAPTWQH